MNLSKYPIIEALQLRIFDERLRSGAIFLPEAEFEQAEKQMLALLKEHRIAEILTEQDGYWDIPHFLFKGIRISMSEHDGVSDQLMITSQLRYRRREAITMYRGFRWWKALREHNRRVFRNMSSALANKK